MKKSLRQTNESQTERLMGGLLERRMIIQVEIGFNLVFYVEESATTEALCPLPIGDGTIPTNGNLS